MNERVYPALGNIRISPEVPGRAKCRVRVVSGGGPMLDVVAKRIDLSGGDFGMLLEVPIRIEHAAQFKPADATPPGEFRYCLRPSFGTALLRM